MKVSWQAFKSFVNSRASWIHGVEDDYVYKLFSKDDFMVVECDLNKNPSDTTDLVEFETTYKQTWNRKIERKDQDGNLVFRTMLSAEGMFFRPRALDFMTGKYNSLCNQNSEGTNLGDAEILFFDESRIPIVKAENESDESFQSRLDATCEHTWLYFTPQTRYAARGVSISKKGVCSGEFDAWFERAPHIPKIYGGSVAAVDGGLPLEMIADGTIITMDAGACAVVEVDPVYISHRMGLKIEHEIGDKVTVLCVFIIYA